MKNKNILKLICYVHLLMIVLSTTSVILLDLLGFTGFSEINGNMKIIQLNKQCQDYTLNFRYRQSNQAYLKISYIYCLIEFAFVTLTLIVVLWLLNGCNLFNQRRQKDKTGIRHPEQNKSTQSDQTETDYLSQFQMRYLYIYMAVSTIASLIPLGQYSKISTDISMQDCFLITNVSQIAILIVFSVLLFILHVVSLILFGLLAINIQKKILSLELFKSRSSVNPQINFIKKQIIPQSQRGLSDFEINDYISHGSNIRNDLGHDKDWGNGILKSESKDSDNLNINQFDNIVRIQSIIYKIDKNRYDSSINL